MTSLIFVHIKNNPIPIPYLYLDHKDISIKNVRHVAFWQLSYTPSYPYYSLLPCATLTYTLISEVDLFGNSVNLRQKGILWFYMTMSFLG